MDIKRSSIFFDSSGEKKSQRHFWSIPLARFFFARFDFCFLIEALGFPRRSQLSNKYQSLTLSDAGIQASPQCRD